MPAALSPLRPVLSDTTRKTGRQRTVLTLALLFTFVLALAVRLPFCNRSHFVYDAADYLRSARLGALADYLDADAMPLTDFVRRFRSDPRFQAHPWGYLYLQNDAAALRHFHVPGGFYVSALLQQNGFGEQAQRIAVAVVSSATVAMAFWILLFAGVPSFAAIPAAIFLSWSPNLILAGTDLSPHPWFTLFAIAAVWALSQWLASASARWAALFTIFFAVSLATLELTPLLFVTAFAGFVFVLIQHRSDRARIRLLLRQAVFCLVGVILLSAVLWPAGWFRGGYVLSYGVFIFQGLFRSAEYFQQRGLLGIVTRLGHGAFYGWSLVLFLAVAVLAALQKNASLLSRLFTLFAALLLLQGFGNTFTNPTYASHAIVAMTIAAALAFPILSRSRSLPGRILGWTTLSFLTLLAGCEMLGLSAATVPEALRTSPRVTATITYLQHTYPPGTAFVVTQDVAPFLAYAPEFHFYPAASGSSWQPKPWVSLPSYYLLVDEEAYYHSPQIPLCSQDLQQYRFAVSCQPITTGSPH